MGWRGVFFRSESGRVNPEQGFRLAWAAGVIVAAMVVLGTPPKAAAHHHCSTVESIGLRRTDWQCRMWCQVWEECRDGWCVKDHPEKDPNSLCQCS